ncbi:MAG TPA: ParB/RepB/Spo0J family partition protein [Bacteroidia bacterium]|nr:MAG: parB-like partition protein [Bacteroidetes bacterium OLB10]MBV6452905.1 putative chromosome-partitioning protein ParB [Bacteroidia bacterium]MBX3106257.1 ParB/RepB/Spo0J family partition protein [Bacteroidota bacterium]MCE7954612.1 ParB/RepB/Spo0J family partition protein [Bacteroidetes bacterium CHB6]MCB8930705.1 ParB/RepB/Spo0J family partition protein [Bacteroidia bacterium]
MTQKKSGLGKGLSALLDNNIPATDLKELNNVQPGIITTLAVEMIEPNPFQPRNEFKEEELLNLADSIRVHGIIQPVTVRRVHADRYQIISGERRFRASQLAGLKSIPVYVRVANDQSMLEMALVENIQRENLNAIEIAISYKRLIDECKLTQEDLGLRVGKDRSTVNNYLRLLKLPPQIQAALRDDKISMGHARAIINISDPMMQIKIFNDIIENDLSVRSVEEVVRGTAKPAKKEVSISEKFLKGLEYKQIQKRLEDKFETKIEVKHRKNGSGQIHFTYFSTDDLNRLLDLLDA